MRDPNCKGYKIFDEKYESAISELRLNFKSNENCEANIWLRDNNCYIWKDTDDMTREELNNFYDQFVRYDPVCFSGTKDQYLQFILTFL